MLQQQGTNLWRACCPIIVKIVVSGLVWSLLNSPHTAVWLWSPVLHSGCFWFIRLNRLNFMQVHAISWINFPVRSHPSHPSLKTPRNVCECACVPLVVTGILLGWLWRFFFYRRGMERTCEAPSNEAPHMILGYRQGRLPTYLQSTVAHAVPLSVCFMVVFACYSHQTGFPQLLSAAAVRSAALLQTSEQNVKQFNCADLFTLRFHHSFWPGNWVNCKPIVKV